ncbi:MAG TPA: TIGR01777 family oxidoreductase [Anaerolineales bacterium]|nr:TIGR01777 family oxidoreductase [Anaerolineales bacterium]
MRVILAGGSGLVGRSLARRLAERGREVVILTRNPTIRSDDPKVRYVAWDGQTSNGWGQLADGAEAIINLAGETIGGRNLAEIFLQRWTRSKKARILESRTGAGRAIVEAVRKAGTKPGTMIQMSAVGYYGPSPVRDLDEGAPSGPDFLASVCRDWESSTAEVEAQGVRRLVVRTGLVLSTKGGLFPVIMLPFRLFVGGRLGTGDQGFSWIHAQDQTRALEFLLDHKEVRGTFNLTAPNPVSNTDLGRHLAKAMRRPFWFPTPAFLLRLGLGQKATLVLDGQFVAPRGLLDAGFEFRFPRLDGALRDLLSIRGGE